MILLNGTELTNYILDTPFSDTIDEELDKQNIQLKSNTKINFKKNDKLEYIVKQLKSDNTEKTIIDKKFCVFEINETYEGLIFIYQLTLLSPTKLLENIIVNGMAETYSTENSQNLKQQIQRVITKINKNELYEKENPISLALDNADAFNYLSSKNANDFLWSSQSTAREILQDICDKADCLIIGTDFTFSSGNITEIKIKAEKREKQGKQLFSYNGSMEVALNEIGSILKGYSINFDSEFNNGNIISLIKNGVCKDNIQQTYLPARNDDMTIDDASDWHIITQEPIYSLNKVIILAPLIVDPQHNYFWVKDSSNEWITKTLNSSSIGNSAFYLYCPFDITEYIVEKDVFDTLPTKTQKKRLYFKRGEKGIYGLYKMYKDAPLWSNTAIQNILSDIGIKNNVLGYVNNNNVVDWTIYDFFQTITATGVDPDFKPILLTATYSDAYNPSVNIHFSTSGDKEVGAIQTLSQSGETGTIQWRSVDFKFSLFSVNYQPYCDAVVKIEKTKINELEGNCKNLSILKNQSDRTIDASKYFDSQQSLINRLGNKELHLDCMFDLNKTILADNSNKTEVLFDLGDYFYCLLQKWTLTKREIQNYGNNKLKCRLTFSQFYNSSNSAINLNRDKRLYGIPLNQYVDRYILFRKPNNKDYTKLLLLSYDDFTANQNESTTDTQTGYCVLDLIKIGNSSTIHKVARCKDNYAVDIERTKYSSTIVNINLRYCDSNGFRTTIIARLLTDAEYNQINITDYSRLPFIQDDNLSIQLGDQVIMDVYKDKMERLIFEVI